MTNLTLDQQAIIFKFLQDGLPLVQKPYAFIAEKANCSQDDVFSYIDSLTQKDAIARFGLVVLHRQLGYVHNAMVVWDVDDDLVDEVASLFCQHSFVHLCYQRVRIPNKWPYNLFTMLHAKSKSDVEKSVNILLSSVKNYTISYDILTTEKAYKQRGAMYVR